MRAREAVQPAESGVALRAAAFTLFTVAAGSIVLPQLPKSWTEGSFNGDDAGFAALYTSLLAIGLLQGSDAARRFVVLGSCLGLPFCALMALAPLPGVGVFALTLALLLLGLAGLLFRRPASGARAVAFGVLAAIGAVGFVPAEVLIARAPRELVRRRLAVWTVPERRFEERELGVSLEVPAAWVVLKSGNPYVDLPGQALGLAQRDGSGRAALQVERDVRDVANLGAYLERQLERWRERAPELVAEPAREVRIGSVAGRRADVSWSDEDGEYAGHVVVWMDQSRFFAWSAWCAASDTAARAALEPLGEQLAATQPLGDAFAGAATRISVEMPQLSRSTIEALLRYRASLASSPPEATYREALFAASRGFTLVTRDEVRDMGEVNGVLYAQVSAADRERLIAYMQRVRAFDSSGSVVDDAWAMRTTRAAVERMPEASRSRLRKMLDVTVLAAIHG